MTKEQKNALLKIENYSQTIMHVRAVQDNIIKVCDLLVKDKDFLELIGEMNGIWGIWKPVGQPQVEMIRQLLSRMLVHDMSKFSENEWPHFAEANSGDKLKSLTYGSDEYKSQLKEILGPALDHHYSNNDHHPEHYEDWIRDATLPAIVEMLCDWEAATRRHKNGDIRKSVEINQERFGYDDKTKEMFNRFYDYILIYN